jgi:enoyl-CoA hydratase/carnithine racemase
MPANTTIPERFTKQDLEEACNDFAMLPFFPQEARASVMMLLAKMCPHRRALRWLVEEVVNHVGKWPGPAELRGLLCTRYDPADGIDHWCSLPGYTAADAEARHYAQHEQLKTQENIGGYLGEEVAPLQQLAQAKAMPRLASGGKR